jgi:hypothetical protein
MILRRKKKEGCENVEERKEGGNGQQLKSIHGKRG